MMETGMIVSFVWWRQVLLFVSHGGERYCLFHVVETCIVVCFTWQIYTFLLVSHGRDMHCWTHGRHTLLFVSRDGDRNCCVFHMPETCLLSMVETYIVVCFTLQRHILFPMAAERHALLLQLDLLNIELSPNRTFRDQNPRVLIYLQCCLSFHLMFLCFHRTWWLRRACSTSSVTGVRPTSLPSPTCPSSGATNKSTRRSARRLAHWPTEWTQVSRLAWQNEHRSVD